MAAISFSTRAGTWKGLDAIVVVLEECRKINYRHKSDSWKGYKYAKPFATDGSETGRWDYFRNKMLSYSSTEL